MDIKAIATDLDGTLLHHRLTISKKNLAALKEFIIKGGIVCFVTGRCFVSAKKFADKFAAKTGYKVHYLSCLKGAILYDNINNKFIYQKAIDHKNTNSIVKICEDNNCSLAAYLKTDLHNKNMWIYGNSKVVNFLNKIKLFPHYYSLEQWEQSNEPYKINISGFKMWSLVSTQLKRLNNCYNEIIKQLGHNVEIAKTSKYMYEVTASNCDKGYAITEISNLTKIKLSEFAAFGDSANDLEMLKKVGLSIAIGKKSSSLNNIANYVVYGYQKNAVSKAINKYINNR